MTRTLDTRVDVIRNGVKLTELSPVDSVSISMDSNGSIKTSLSGVFLVNDKVDWLSDEISPVAIIDGVEHRLGIFIPTTISRNRENDVMTISVEGYDRCWQIENTKTSEILSIASGTNYVTAVETLLVACGISLIIKEPTTSTLTSIREDWDIGTDYLTIINQLLSEINYSDLWFDNNGYAILEPSQMLHVEDIKRTYDYNDVGSMMLTSSNAQLDLFSVPNVFLCVCSNADKSGVMKATARNENLSSPFSIQRRGKEIMEMYQVDNIASQQDLEDYAAILCNKAMFQGQKIEIVTAIRTDCGVNDVVALSHPDANGLCFETEWRIDLATGGQMTHVLQQQPRATI